MSLIVCNAGPLIALEGIGQVDLLQKLFGTVLVPDEVKEEVEAGEIESEGGGLFSANSWIHVTTHAQTFEPLLASLLDRGEAATIALALQNSADLVLIDEVKARRVARDVYGLSVVGTGRILVEAKHSFLVKEVRPLLELMRANGYWIADRIVAEVLRQAEE